MAEIPSPRRILALRKKRSSERSSEEHVSPTRPKTLQNDLDSTHADHVNSENAHYTRSKTRTSSSTAIQQQHSCKDTSTAKVPGRDDGVVAHNSSEQTYSPATATSPEKSSQRTQCDKDDVQPKTEELEASRLQIPSIIIHDSNGTIIMHSEVNNDGGESTSDANDAILAESTGSERVIEVKKEDGDLSTKTNLSGIIDTPHVTESSVVNSSVELYQLSRENFQLRKRLREPESELNGQSERIRALNVNKRNLNQQDIDSRLALSHKENTNGSPLSVLEVILSRLNLDPRQPRCSATKVDKNTCGAKIKETEMNKAFKVLRAMSFCDDADERTLAKELEGVVRLLICKRGAHQRQANGIAAYWARILCQPVENSVKIGHIQIGFVSEDGKFSLRKLIPPTANGYWHLSLRDHLKAIIDKPFKMTDVMEGYVYIYSVNSNFGLVKIGWTRDTPNKRLQRWENQCKRKTYLAYPEASKELIKIPHAWRVEKLVQAELKKYSKWETECGCKTKTHKEWFEISLPHAIKLVEFWSAWVQTHPYEERPGDWPKLERDALPAWALKESHRAELDSLLDKIENRDVERRERLQSPPLQRRARSENAMVGSPARNTRSAIRRRELEQGFLGSPTRQPLQGRRARSAPDEQSASVAEAAKFLLSPDFMRSWKEEPVMTGSKKDNARK